VEKFGLIGKTLKHSYSKIIHQKLGDYSYELYELESEEIKDFIATKLITSEGEEYPVNGITACADAVLMRKEQPFPIGQRIPAPMLSRLTDKTDGLVTKPLLRTAIQKSSLIKLTLSLPPYCIHLNE
jgi:hypothetical protein